MIMNKNDYTFPYESAEFNRGLTVRDYIAIKAMQGILANPKLTPDFDTAIVENVESRAYEFADSMIKWSEI